MEDKPLVVDMQHHYIPSDALRLVKKCDEYDYTVGLKRYAKAYQTMINIDKHLEWMDRAGIDVAVLSTASFAANGSEFCEVCNNGYSEVVRRHPDRFKGMIHVYPLDDAKKNEDEIKRGVEDLGLWG